MCSTLPADLPQDLIDLILLHLPARSIGRFRSVSKYWRSYLSTPQFVKAHLKYLHTEDVICVYNRSLYVLTFDVDEERISSGGCVLKEIKPSFEFIKSRDEWPDDIGEVDFEVGGSCHGLVLLAARNCEFAKFLINPITLENERVHGDSLQGRFIAYGLGYDESEDDYKIVSLIGEGETRNIHGSDGSLSVDIYSFKTKTWRSISLQTRLAHEFYVLDASGVFVNGCFHWIVTDKADVHAKGARRVILSYNLAREEFEVVPLPSEIESQFEQVGCRIRVFRGCLATALVGNDFRSYDVWMMKDYGVRDSWTKLTFHCPDLCGRYEIVCLLNDSELVLKKYKSSFISCDSRDRGSKDLAVAGDPRKLELDCTYRCVLGAFRGSLVSPHNPSSTASVCSQLSIMNP